MSKHPRAEATVQIDDARVRVTLFRIAPGEATGWHRHAHDYVIVPLTDGTLRLESAEGATKAALAAGRSYARAAGVEHDVVNAGNAPLAFVEIELK